MTPFLQELKKKFETGESLEEEGGSEDEGGESKGSPPRDGGKGPVKKS
jgi:hypothetical protein